MWKWSFFASVFNLSYIVDENECPNWELCDDYDSSNKTPRGEFLHDIILLLMTAYIFWEMNRSEGFTEKQISILHIEWALLDDFQENIMREHKWCRSIICWWKSSVEPVMNLDDWFIFEKWTVLLDVRIRCITSLRELWENKENVKWVDRKCFNKLGTFHSPWSQSRKLRNWFVFVRDIALSCLFCLYSWSQLKCAVSEDAWIIKINYCWSRNLFRKNYRLASNRSAYFGSRQIN